MSYDIRNQKTATAQRVAEIERLNSLALRSKLNKAYEEAQFRRKENERLDIEPAIPIYRSKDELQADLTTQRQILKFNLQEVMTPDEIQKFLGYTFKNADYAVLTNEYWDDIEPRIKEYKPVAANFLIEWLNRYFYTKQKMGTKLDVVVDPEMFGDLNDISKRASHFISQGKELTPEEIKRAVRELVVRNYGFHLDPYSDAKDDEIRKFYIEQKIIPPVKKLSQKDWNTIYETENAGFEDRFGSYLPKTRFDYSGYKKGSPLPGTLTAEQAAEFAKKTGKTGTLVPVTPPEDRTQAPLPPPAPAPAPAAAPSIFRPTISQGTQTRPSTTTQGTQAGPSTTTQGTQARPSTTTQGTQTRPIPVAIPVAPVAPVVPVAPVAPVVPVAPVAPIPPVQPQAQYPQEDAEKQALLSIILEQDPNGNYVINANDNPQQIASDLVLKFRQNYPQRSADARVVRRWATELWEAQTGRNAPRNLTYKQIMELLRQIPSVSVSLPQTISQAQRLSQAQLQAQQVAQQAAQSVQQVAPQFAAQLGRQLVPRSPEERVIQNSMISMIRSDPTITNRQTLEAAVFAQYPNRPVGFNLWTYLQQAWTAWRTASGAPATSRRSYEGFIDAIRTVPPRPTIQPIGGVPPGEPPLFEPPLFGSSIRAHNYYRFGKYMINKRGLKKKL